VWGLEERILLACWLPTRVGTTRCFSEAKVAAAAASLLCWYLSLALSGWREQHPVPRSLPQQIPACDVMERPKKPSNDLHAVRVCDIVAGLIAFASVATTARHPRGLLFVHTAI